MVLPEEKGLKNKNISCRVLIPMRPENNRFAAGFAWGYKDDRSQRV